MHRVFPHGVGQFGAKDHTSGTPVTSFARAPKWYALNSSLGPRQRPHRLRSGLMSHQATSPAATGLVRRSGQPGADPVLGRLRVVCPHAAQAAGVGPAKCRRGASLVEATWLADGGRRSPRSCCSSVVGGCPLRQTMTSRRRQHPTPRRRRRATAEPTPAVETKASNAEAAQVDRAARGRPGRQAGGAEAGGRGARRVRRARGPLAHGRAAPCCVSSGLPVRPSARAPRSASCSRRRTRPCLGPPGMTQANADPTAAQRRLPGAGDPGGRHVRPRRRRPATEPRRHPAGETALRGHPRGGPRRPSRGGPTAATVELHPGVLALPDACLRLRLRGWIGRRPARTPGSSASPATTSTTSIATATGSAATEVTWVSR